MTKQATLVSLYGDKDPRLAQFIRGCQAAVASALGDAFEPYALGQVHATIVGLEKRQGTHNQNRNFWQYQTRLEEMDVEGYVDFLQNTALLPFDVQFGGTRIVTILSSVTHSNAGSRLDPMIARSSSGMTKSL